MKKDSITRRSFLKKTSKVLTGATLATVGTASIYGNIMKDSDKPAVLGGKPVRTKPFPSWPVFDETDIQMYLDAYHSKVWSEFRYKETERVVQFEKKYAALMEVKYCAATNAGTTALTTAVQAIGVGPGDEVIVPTNTFIATAQIVFNVFALPVFVDSDPETFMINADLIEERITEHTRAIIPVHIGGGACDMDKIMAISKKHNVPVVEDACQAHLGEWRGKKLGSVGDLGCFSFQAFKSITSGEGGAVIGDNEALMDRCIAFKNNGRDPKWKRSYPGSNFRMTPFQAAVVMGGLRHAEEQARVRDENSAYLEDLIKDIPGFTPCKKYPGQTRRAYYGYKMIYDKNHFNGLPRNKFLKAMRAEGIPISRGCDTLNKHPFIEEYLSLRSFQKIFSKERLIKYRKGNHCPANDKIAEEIGLSIGHSTFLGTKKDMEDIAEAVTKIQKNSVKLS